MNDMQIHEILKIGERSCKFILSNNELCERIRNEKPISLDDYLTKTGASRHLVMNLIEKGIVSKFSNSPNRGSKWFVFENELDDVLGNLVYTSSILYKKMDMIFQMLAELNEDKLSEREFYYLINFMNNGIDELSDNTGLTKTRLNQIINRTFWRLLKAVKRLPEITELTHRKINLITEIQFLEKQKLKLNDIPTGSKVNGLSKKQIAGLNKDLYDLDLSVRAFNLLKANKINSVQELIRIDEETLIRYRNCGRKSLAEIKDVLADFDLKLGMTKVNNN